MRRLDRDRKNLPRSRADALERTLGALEAILARFGGMLI